MFKKCARLCMKINAHVISLSFFIFKIRKFRCECRFGAVKAAISASLAKKQSATSCKSNATVSTLSRGKALRTSSAAGRSQTIRRVQIWAAGPNKGLDFVSGSPLALVVTLDLCAPQRAWEGQIGPLRSPRQKAASSWGWPSRVAPLKQSTARGNIIANGASKRAAHIFAYRKRARHRNGRSHTRRHTRPVRRINRVRSLNLFNVWGAVPAVGRLDICDDK